MKGEFGHCRERNKLIAYVSPGFFVICLPGCSETINPCVIEKNKLLWIMKRLQITSLLSVLLLLVFSLSGCLQDKCTQTATYYTYQPIYQSYETIRAAVKAEPARELKNPGKMYFKDSYILISEVNEGIHVINNQDPTNPVNEAFIVVPGNHDISAKGNVLYADSYMDLVTLDISNITQAAEVSRVQNVFEYGSWHIGLWADPALGVAVDWAETQVVEETECMAGGGWGGCRNCFLEDGVRDVALFASNSSVAPSQTGNVTAGADVTTGVGGSMARFTIVNDYLYTVSNSTLTSYFIGTLTNPVVRTANGIGWGIETIFPYENRLFIGTTTGMLIYGLDNPNSPNYISSISHVTSCDPVAVEGDYAYSTLRGGDPCGNTFNQLDVINISNIQSPVLEHTYPMSGPYGLGIRNNVLFICDGEEGLKIYDATDKALITSNQLAHFPGIKAYDVIPMTNILLMIGEDGFYQYDYSDLKNIRLIGSIPVVAE